MIGPLVMVTGRSVLFRRVKARHAQHGRLFLDAARIGQDEPRLGAAAS